MHARRQPRRLGARALLALALFVSLAIPSTFAQFGQNKITYDVFDWQVYESPHFDIHYYAGMESQLEDLVNELESSYLDISGILDHELSKRIPVILYRTQRDFQQTNIQLFEIPDGVGAFAEPIQNRMVLPIDDPPDKRYKLIRHELVHIFQFDILYSESLRRTLRGSPPLWLMEGMASYIADDEDSFDQMVIRDAVVNNIVPSVRQLNVFSFLTYRYGHAIFDFIEQEYGPERVRSFLFEFRRVLLAQNLEKAFRDSLGVGIDAFDRRFNRFLRRKYLPILTDSRSPDEYGDEIGFSRPGVFTFSPTLSPSGDLVATLSTVGREELDIVVVSAADGEKVRNVTRGFTNRYRYLLTEAFEGKRDLAWSPVDDELAVFVLKERHHELAIFDPLSGKRLEQINLGDVTMGASPAYSPDGRRIAFSANKDGVWDIFAYDLETGEIENLTQDRYVDSNPSWSSDGEQLLYNRRIGAFDKIFSVEVGSPERKTQLTAGAASDLQPTLSRDGKWIYFTSDRGLYGVFNLHRLELATGDLQRLVDLSGGAFSPVELPAAEDGTPVIAFTAYYGGTFRLFKMKVGGEEVERSASIGQKEPRNSPLAPSRQEQKEKAIRAQEVGEEPPVPPTPEETEDADLEPFEPPLDLGVDEERMSPYKLKWDIDAPSITVGVTDDGTFLGDSSIVISDLLGDHRFFISLAARDDLASYLVSYTNYKRRLNWGARIFDYRDYYVLLTQSGDLRQQRAYRLTQATAFASYPINRYFRIEGSAGYVQRRQDFPVFDQDTGELRFTRFSDDYPIASFALVGDTVRYKPGVGPFHGYQMRIGAFAYSFTSGDNSGDNVTGYELDLRGYQKVTSRSNLAFRLKGLYQEGEQASYAAIGGIDQIRSVDYRDLFGNSYAFMNLEYRFPLFNGIQWAFGMVTAPVQVFAFVDIGSAWFEDTLYVNSQTLEFEKGRAAWDPNFGLREFDSREDGLLKDIYASAGLGLRAPIFGLPMTWAFARAYDGEDFGKWRSSFYITYTF